MNLSPRVFIREQAVQLWTLVSLLILAILGWDVLFWDATSADFDRVDSLESYFYDSSGGSQLIALAAAAWIVWRRRHVVAACASGNHSGRRWALAPMGLALGMRAWAEHTGAVDLQIPALALALLGGGGVIGGCQAMRFLLAPAAVLLLAMPIPLGVVNVIIYPMQRMTAEGVSALLGVLRIPHVLLGEQFFAREHVFYVIEGCAGLRGLLTLILATAVYVEALFRSRRQVLVLFALTPLVAIAVNQLRVLSIVLSPSSDFSADHVTQGILMICLGVVVVAGIDSGLERLERRAGYSLAGRAVTPPRSRGSGSVDVWTRRAVGLRIAPTLVFATAYGLVGLSTPTWSAPEAPKPRLRDVPTRIGEWRATRTLKPDLEFLGSVEWSDWLGRRFVSTAGDEIELFVFADDRRRRDQSLLSFKTALARPGQRIEERREVRIGQGGRPADGLLLRGVDKRVAVVHWNVGASSLLEEMARSALALDQSVFHRGERMLAIRLAIVLSDDPSENHRRNRLLLEMAEQVDDVLTSMGIVATQG